MVHTVFFWENERVLASIASVCSPVFSVLTSSIKYSLLDLGSLHLSVYQTGFILTSDYVYDIVEKNNELVHINPTPLLLSSGPRSTQRCVVLKCSNTNQQMSKVTIPGGHTLSLWKYEIHAVLLFLVCVVESMFCVYVDACWFVMSF